MIGREKTLLSQMMDDDNNDKKNSKVPAGRLEIKYWRRKYGYVVVDMNEPPFGANRTRSADQSEIKFSSNKKIRKIPRSLCSA